MQYHKSFFLFLLLYHFFVLCFCALCTIQHLNRPSFFPRLMHRHTDTDRTVPAAPGNVTVQSCGSCALNLCEPCLGFVRELARVHKYMLTLSHIKGISQWFALNLSFHLAMSCIPTLLPCSGAFRHLSSAAALFLPFSGYNCAGNSSVTGFIWWQ